jgi:signal transduction histidine kinase
MISNLQELRTHLNPLNDLAAAVRDAASAVERKDLRLAAAALKRMGEFNLPDLIQEHGEMVQDSIDGAERVSKIVKALRELARQEVDIIEPSSVNASVTRVTRALAGSDPAIILDLSTEEAAVISPLQLDQVLEQLLRNARQAVTADQQVTVRTRSTDTQVIIEVDDQGCGIPPDHRPRIFEPFFTTRGVGQGIGLGLTVAYGIVSRNSGTITVQSEVGRGTRVTVSLPRHLRAPSSDSLSAKYGHPADEKNTRTHLN